MPSTPVPHPSHQPPGLATSTALAAALAEEHQRLLESLDTAHLPKPFRNPNWKPSARRNKNIKQILSEAARREANLSNSVAVTQTNSGASTPRFTAGGQGEEGTRTPAEPSNTGVKGGRGPPNIAQAAQSLSTLVLERNLQRATATTTTHANGASTPLPLHANGNTSGGPPAVTYTNIEAAPSLHPGRQKHYCDITGLPARYTDPKTRLRYHDKEIFGVVRTLPPGGQEGYLAARGAGVVLK